MPHQSENSKKVYLKLPMSCVTCALPSNIMLSHPLVSRRQHPKNEKMLVYDMMDIRDYCFTKFQSYWDRGCPGILSQSHGLDNSYPVLSWNCARFSRLLLFEMLLRRIERSKMARNIDRRASHIINNQQSNLL